MAIPRVGFSTSLRVYPRSRSRLGKKKVGCDQILRCLSPPPSHPGPPHRTPDRQAETCRSWQEPLHTQRQTTTAEEESGCSASTGMRCLGRNRTRDEVEEYEDSAEDLELNNKSRAGRHRYRDWSWIGRLGNGGMAITTISLLMTIVAVSTFSASLAHITLGTPDRCSKTSTRTTLYDRYDDDFFIAMTTVYE